MGRPKVTRQHIPNPDGPCCRPPRGFLGYLERRTPAPSLVGAAGRSRGLKAAQGAGAEGALAGLLTLTRGGRGLGAVL